MTTDLQRKDASRSGIHIQKIREDFYTLQNRAAEGAEVPSVTPLLGRLKQEEGYTLSMGCMRRSGPIPRNSRED